MAASFGMTPTTSVTGLTYPISRSMGLVTGMRIAGADGPAAVALAAAYGATIRDRGTGSTKVRAGRSVR